MGTSGSSFCSDSYSHTDDWKFGQNFKDLGFEERAMYGIQCMWSHAAEQCMRMCVGTCVYVHVWVHACVHVWVRVCRCMFGYMLVCVCVCVHACVHVCDKKALPSGVHTSFAGSSFTDMLVTKHHW